MYIMHSEPSAPLQPSALCHWWAWNVSLSPRQLTIQKPEKP